MSIIYKWLYEGYDRVGHFNVSDVFAYSDSKHKRPSWYYISDDIRVHKVYYMIISTTFQETSYFERHAKDGILYSPLELRDLVRREQEVLRKKEQQEREHRLAAQRQREQERREQEERNQRAALEKRAEEEERRNTIIAACAIAAYYLIGVAVYFFYAQDEFYRSTFSAIMYSLFWPATVAYDLIC